ncbi:PIG-L family deacetylase [Herbiconiux liukaitaii]|uniref:PIG-L family deacetylase n=1 Tax=Herbiconiux liukaitaii TaxID=3342799 RepID=UPI0035B6E4A7
MTGPLDAFGDAPFFVHAHPDDESISTGGAIAALVARGASVTIITGTRGERGEVVAGDLAPLEGTAELAPHRMIELENALEALGGPHHVFLGTSPARAPGAADRLYSDSGMQWGDDGFAEPAADAAPDALSTAPLADVVADLHTAVRDEHGHLLASALVSYDARGGYGHPDHVRIHDAAREVARLTGLPFFAIVEPRVLPEGGGAGGGQVEEFTIRLTPELLAAKTAAMAAHRSQLTIEPTAFTLSGGQTHPIPTLERFRRLA